MSRMMTVVAALLCVSVPAFAQTLKIDKALVTYKDQLKVTLELKDKLAQAGSIAWTWTDGFGRTVATGTVDAKADQAALEWAIPLRPAVTMLNTLEVELKAGDAGKKLPKADFIVTPANPWDDYEIVMYNGYKTPQQQLALRDVGITSGQLQSGRTQDPNGGKNWWQYGYQFYCDQIATSFYASYHTPSQNPKQKALIDAKALYKKDTTSKEAFFRKPSLSDPDALAKAVGAIKKAVESQMRFKPFFYAPTDEGGVADLVTAWDFDFSPLALQAMRKWLMERYGSLEAINKEWETTFKTIDEVTPLSTDEMMAKKSDNLSPWADHRAFMNKAFADAVRAGTDGAHQVDKNALTGLVGCQMPSAFGGYDYWLLSQAMDAIEPYNIGNNREIWRSLAPGKPAMTTAFGFGNFEVWRLWYQALHGDQGIIIYDEKYTYLDADAKPTMMASEIAPTYKELTGGIVKQLHYATRMDDPIAIHYSQPSITAHWMIEAKPGGTSWSNRGSASERKQSEFLRVRAAWTKLIEDGLRQYGFAAYAQLEDGTFDKSPAKVLILPQSVAMSVKECKAVRDFVARGGTVIADCRTALMDEHCKLLPKGQLDDLFGIERADTKFAPGKAGLTLAPLRQLESLYPWATTAALAKVPAAEPGVKVAAGAVALYQDDAKTPAVIVKQHDKGTTIYLNAVVTDYHRWRLKPPEGEALEALVAGMLKGAGVKNEYNVTAGDKPVAGVELFPFATGDLKMLALHRNYQLGISELGPTEYQKQDELEKPLELTVKLDKEYAVYDTRAGKFMGKKNAVTVSLDKYQPTILALLPEPVKELKITAPAEAKAGDVLDVKLELVGPNLGDQHAFRAVLVAPDGKEVMPLTANLVAPKGQATWRVPLALSDAKGAYKLQVKDVATGTKAEQTLTVK